MVHAAETQPLDLSVVVVVLEGGASLARCLTGLAQQSSDASAEVIVPFDQGTADIASIRRSFPAVRFELVAGAASFARLRARGVRTAHGRIVALTEDHCVADPQWYAEILRAHESPHQAIGGAIEKEGADTAWNWALYLCDYVRYRHPQEAGPARSLSDCNVSYKRGALDAIAEVWEEEFHENTVHDALRNSGAVLWLAPRMIVRQRRQVRPATILRQRFSHGRTFGGTRVAGLSRGRRWLFLAASPWLPFLLVFRVARESLKRHLAREWFRALPAIIMMSCVWASGECVGYLTGRAGRARVAARLTGGAAHEEAIVGTRLRNQDAGGRETPD